MDIITSDLSVCDLKNKEWKVVLSNLTAPDLHYDATPIEITLELVGTSYSFTKIISTGTLEGFSEDTLTIESGFDFAPGQYIVKANISSIIGEAFMDTITISPSLSVRIETLSDCQDDDFVIGGTEIQQTVVITNTGNMDLSGMNINLILDVHSDSYKFRTSGSFSDVLQPGGSKTYAFANKFTVPMDAECHIDVVAYLSCDSAMLNADTSATECVDDNDLYIVDIVHPTRTAVDQVGDTIKPKVLIGNHCMKDFEDIEITALIVDLDGTEQGRIEETITRINMIDTSEYTFNAGYIVPAIKNYKLIVYFKSVDNYTFNDTMGISRTTNHVGIEDINNLSISMEQNIPNPVKESTIIRYSIPQDGEVSFKIYSISGQILYNKAENVQSGDHQIEINTSNFAAGIYFYTMEFEGQRITKRMNKQ